MKRKILIVELWGLGDLTFSTPAIAAALDHDEVHLVGKPHARPLLEPSYPALQFIPFDAPWTAYTGKYKLWKWNFLALIALIRKLRRENYDIAVSARNDPRDHFFMWLIGAKHRIGFEQRPIFGLFDVSRALLTSRLNRIKPKQHKVEDWRQLGGAMSLPGAIEGEPRLDPIKYHTSRMDELFAHVTKPILCLHTGARIAVRRWPESYYAHIIARLRTKFDFHLVIIPEPLTLPSSLAELADTYLVELSIADLVSVLGHSDLLLCNDSGPGHIAASCGQPVISIFGPSDPDWFRPWGDKHRVILRDICPWRPCFDYCKFSEPYCMTKLLPDNVWPEIQQQINKLIDAGRLPAALSKNAAQPAGAGI
ncbi:MAG: glycosyltransferase family 9 protein [Chthoniobacteraceae bacterium]